MDPQGDARDDGGDEEEEGLSRARLVSVWPETWQDFIRTLRDPRQDFNPFVWIIRLLKAGIDHIYVHSGCEACIFRFGLHKAWRPMVPYFGLGLVVLVVLAYYRCVRFVIHARWCCRPFYVAGMISLNQSSGCKLPCYWMYLHDTLVAYFACMISFHYVCTVFASPGVALPTHVTSHHPPQWKAIKCQGGMLGFDPTCWVEKERARVLLYGHIDPKYPGAVNSNAVPRASEQSSSQQQQQQQQQQPALFPSPEPSFCEKCQIMRPPRCRHCSVCQRCVLQFDHHCMWVNQCIGYNNYRHFVLMLFFLMTGCWYGVALLFQIFYEPFRQQIREHGFRWMYSNGTGVLDLPMPHIILMHLWRWDMPAKMIIDMVYPLLMAVGAVLSCFLGFHVKYILLARTTLEHSILLEYQLCQTQISYNSMRSRGSTPSHRPVVLQWENPFDQGYRRNLQQVLGPSILVCFLPVRVNLCPPYLPERDKSR